jgi:hypothetical protein
MRLCHNASAPFPLLPLADQKDHTRICRQVVLGYSRGRAPEVPVQKCLLEFLSVAVSRLAQYTAVFLGAPSLPRGLRPQESLDNIAKVRCHSDESEHAG